MIPVNVGWMYYENVEIIEAEWGEEGETFCKKLLRELAEEMHFEYNHQYWTGSRKIISLEIFASTFLSNDG